MSAFPSPTATGIFRRIALQSPSRFTVCTRCLRQVHHLQPPPVSSSSSSRILKAAAPKRLFAASAWALNSSNATKPVSSPLAAAAAAVAAESPPATRRELFPKTTSKAVGYWLIASAVGVFGIVVWGGLTRLTESGLSITEWKPVTGTMPPTSHQDWESEFELYRASPEFKILNPHMTLDEFKRIYFMEWSHRLWGRLIGLTFVLPTLYLVARRRHVSARMAANLVGISALIGIQGVIGWWMVQSGLHDDQLAAAAAPGGSPPRVSHYRLAAHLGTAFVCYAWMFLSGLAVLRTHRFTAAADPRAALDAVAALRRPAIVPFRRAVLAVTALVFVTAMSGALVAGLDAGLIYNEFPRMGLGLVPPSSELWDSAYARRPDASDLWWRNLLENPSTVQMNHRILACTTFSAIVALFVFSRRGRVAPALPRNVRSAALGLVHLVCLQVALGITTLIYMVPIPLGAAHQAGSLAVLTGALVLAHRLHVPKSTVRALQQRLKHVKHQ